MTEAPVFAVVGHPNKGKSSIVATLALDDTVVIAPTSGTTRHDQAFPMKIDGQLIYELIDTPGFQRARRALAWMKDEAKNIHERPEVVRRFVETWRDTDKFSDECELLSPIINGAGIIYVVDGSRPYGSEYEAEMEILRWTGQASLALINPIDSDEYVEEWRAALNQYFKIVRVFNAMTVEFQKRMEVLNAFGQLNEAWRQPLQVAVDALLDRREQQHQQAARTIARMVADMSGYLLEKKIPSDAKPETYKAKMEERFLKLLQQMEKKSRQEIQQLYQHQHLKSQEETFELLDSDLFVMKDWYFWGLDKVQLTAISAVAGASAGLVVDAVVGGSSLFLGAVTGGLLSGAGVWLAADKIAQMKVSGLLPLGGKQLIFGPVTNRNFPYVLLGRAIYHQQRIAGRPHAQRNELVLQQVEQSSWLNKLTQDQRKQLDKLCKKLSNQEKPEETQEALSEWVYQLLCE